MTYTYFSLGTGGWMGFLELSKWGETCTDWSLEGDLRACDGVDEREPDSSSRTEPSTGTSSKIHS